MRKMITRLTAIALICTMIAGCSSNSRKSKRDNDDDDDSDKTEATTESSEVDKDSLEYYMNQPDTKKMLDDQVSELLSNPSYKDIFKDIKWEAKNNDLTYSYYYAQDFTDVQISQIKDNLDKQIDSLNTTIDSVKDSLEKSIGIRPASITYVYFDASGNEITRISH